MRWGGGLLFDGDLDAIALDAVGGDVEFGGAGVVEGGQFEFDHVEADVSAGSIPRF